MGTLADMIRMVEVNITQQPMHPFMPAASPAAFRAPQLSSSDSALARISYYALLLWIFLYLSRILDVTAPFLKIPMLLNVIWAVGALVSGGILLFLTNRVGIYMLAFSTWAAITVPLSVWRGGSFDTFQTLMRSVVLAIAIMALVKTTVQCRQIMFTIGYAIAAAAVISVVSGEQSVNGRLSISSGAFSDPNYYCIALVSGLPFLLLKSSVATSRLGAFCRC